MPEISVGESTIKLTAQAHKIYTALLDKPKLLHRDIKACNKVLLSLSTQYAIHLIANQLVQKFSDPSHAKLFCVMILAKLRVPTARRASEPSQPSPALFTAPAFRSSRSLAASPVRNPTLPEMLEHWDKLLEKHALSPLQVSATHN
jgi:hypothetical protein